ncbi:unnamed protein product [Closterium sp. NIES-65]|nr:unnamed protein product [Closterium sp. NIES-65]
MSVDANMAPPSLGLVRCQEPRQVPGAPSGARSPVRCQESCQVPVRCQEPRQACGGNATCIKDSAGVASCVCRAGFVLQADKKTCTDTCVLKRCGGNAKCVKSAAGVAFCACDTGFVLQPDGVTCTDACALKACGGNGTCIKDGTTGVASCVCDTGFVLQPDGITCTDTCAIKGCNAAVTDCVKDAAGAASCVCKTGYQNVSGTCMGPASMGGLLPTPGATCTVLTYSKAPYPTAWCQRLPRVGSALQEPPALWWPVSCGVCPAGATCTVVPYTKAAYCACPPGYGMTAAGCVLGATPTVSSASFTYYTLPSFGITPAAYTMRLAYNGCTNLTAASAPSIQSYCNVERAPGGVGDCTEIRQYYQPGCVGAYSLFPVTPGTGMSTGSIPNCRGYPFRSFACSITGGCSCVAGCSCVGGCSCAEKCAPNTCGGNSTCVQDSVGVAFCACNAGFLLQGDSKTCTGMCICCTGNAYQMKYKESP